MFWIIVLVIVIVIVIFAVKNSVKKNKRIREQIEERQKYMKDLETRAAAGDEAAKQELEAEKQKLEAAKEAAKQALIEKGTYAGCMLHCAGSMPNNIVGLTDRKIKEAIAQNGGPDDWEETCNKTKKVNAPPGETWTLEYKSLKGDSIRITYSFYRVGQFKDASTGRPVFGPNSWIDFGLELKMLPEIVQAIRDQVEHELRDYLSSNGETFLK
jgi:Sec-independent protein translocase protein TatA